MDLGLKLVSNCSLQFPVSSNLLIEYRLPYIHVIRYKIFVYPILLFVSLVLVPQPMHCIISDEAVNKDVTCYTRPSSKITRPTFSDDRRLPRQHLRPCRSRDDPPRLLRQRHHRGRIQGRGLLLAEGGRRRLRPRL